jgi:hypothetical protein
MKYQERGLRKLYFSPNAIRMVKSRRMRWTEHIARIGERMNSCRFLVGQPQGNRPVCRLRRMWDDNIKINIREIQRGDVHSIYIAQDRG